MTGEKKLHRSRCHSICSEAPGARTAAEDSARWALARGIPVPRPVPSATAAPAMQGILGESGKGRAHRLYFVCRVLPMGPGSATVGTRISQTARWEHSPDLYRQLAGLQPDIHHSGRHLGAQLLRWAPFSL